MEKVSKSAKVIEKKPRGWEALEIMLKERGVSGAELEEARQSFYKGIETLSKMFLSCYSAEKRDRGRSSGIS